MQIHRVFEMAQLAEHWSSLLGDSVLNQKVASLNPNDTGRLFGSHLNELVQHTNKTV